MSAAVHEDFALREGLGRVIYSASRLCRVSLLTDNIHVILDAIRTSSVVEVQGEKVRKRNDWMRWIVTTPVQFPNVSSPQYGEKSGHDMLAAHVQGISSQEMTTGHIKARSQVDVHSEAFLGRSLSGDLNSQSQLSSSKGIDEIRFHGAQSVPSNTLLLLRLHCFTPEKGENKIEHSLSFVLSTKKPKRPGAKTLVLYPYHEPLSLSLPPSSSVDGGDTDIPDPWYGNIQYLLNISTIGLFFCIFIFLFAKLRSDHRRMPVFSALTTKLLAVWHATGREIASHCGADGAQFLIIEGGSFVVVFSIGALSTGVLLPLNVYGGSQVINDEFSKTTINHIEKVHFGMSSIEKRLKVTRFRDGNGNLSDPNANSTAAFTIMVQGLPKSIGDDRRVLQEYFQYRYPGKIYKVIVPVDLCAFIDLATELVKVRDGITWLVVKIDSRLLPEENEGRGGGDGFWEKLRRVVIWLWRNVKSRWEKMMDKLGYMDEEKLRILLELRVELETKLAEYKEGRAPGAGVAFVIFKDVYTAKQAVQDFCNEKKRRFGKFFSVMEFRLRRNQWKVERAPLAPDIYWNHLGSSKLSMRLRRLFVNTCLLLMLVFFSSPLAVISALNSAGRIIDAEAMNNAQSWLDWVQSSSWLASLTFQFLPNVIIFVSMYIIIPSALSYLSKFERHLIVSEEQRAALLKMVCFFLVNLILLRGLVESSLESAILNMGRCYLDGEDCKRIEQYMSASFLSRSCLSSLAFLITSTFLGISYDLLAPIPWIKKKIQKFQKNDMLQLVPEQSEEYPLEGQAIDALQRPLIPDNAFDSPRYVVDKYNFLFVYRVRGFPAGNDGRLMDTVLCIMRFCVDLFLFSMLLFFSIQGDSMKLQAIFTLGLLVLYKLLPSDNDSFQPALLERLQNVDSIVEGPIGYEVFSQPWFDWDTYHS
ncbi:hypothetical protein POTOM_028294 [Populus tomentosa]|uniref:Uncharacterized protein n=1 Tax=Populus tomentosa TaxID=118781 RepID=A0A8X7ZE78_POPTO|nr:hypothetical protein POTOM_028294 [Populus tomentosa]